MTTSFRNRMPEWKKKRARQMRNNPTPAERELWSLLRKRNLNGLRFLRQVPMVGYIVDFYCPLTKLVVEVDGPYHESKKEYDRKRDRHLSRLGFNVIRFTNEEVLNAKESVLDRIRVASLFR